MVVTVDHDIDAAVVQRRPERGDRSVVAVFAGGEPWLVPDRDRAAGSGRLEVRGKPPTLS